MRKCALVLGFALVVCGCNDDDQECPEQTCPSLQCNGKECPSCPACKQDCSKCGGGSGTCDTSAKDAQISKLTGDLATCNGNLDSCNAGLGDKARSVKSGSRITITQLQGEDGSQFPSFTYFDKQKNKPCTPIDFSTIYGCDLGTYCVTSSNYAKFDSYIDSSLYVKSYENQLAPSIVSSGYACSKNLSDEGTASYFTGLPQRIYSAYRVDNYKNLFTDDNCTTNLSNDFILDSTCAYNKDSIIYEEVTVSNSSGNVTENTCIDGSTYTSYPTTTVKNFYKPKNAGFAKLYSKSGNSCVEYGFSNVILLEKDESISYDYFIQKTKANRNTVCSKICNAIRQEAIDQDWVKLNPVEL